MDGEGGDGGEITKESPGRQTRQSTLRGFHASHGRSVTTPVNPLFARHTTAEQRQGEEKKEEEGSTLSAIPATLASTVTSEGVPSEGVPALNASAAALPMSVCTQLSRTCQPPHTIPRLPTDAKNQ